MLGSGQRAKRFLDELRGFAEKTPFEFPDLIKASQRLLAFGFNAKQVIPTLTSVGDAVAGMGGDPQALEATIRAIGQIASKGRLMAEEMMQLNEAGTFSWRALAAEIGTSVPKAMELVSKGAVSADMFLAAFQRSSTRRFKGMMDEQSRTFGGLLSTLKDRFASFSADVTKPLFDLAVRVMKRLSDDGGTATAISERLAAVMRDKVVPALERIWEHFRDNWPKIKGFLSDSWGFTKDLAGALRSLAGGAGRVADAMGGWGEAFKLILAGTLATKVGNLTKAFTGLAIGQGAASAAAATGGIGLAGATAARLLTTLRALGRFGALAIPITLLIFHKEVGEFFSGRGKPRVGQVRGVAADGVTPGFSVWNGTRWVDSDESGTLPSAGAVKSLVAGQLGGKGPRRSTLTPGTAALAGVLGGTVTSTTRGRHTPGSFHFAGQALDLAVDAKVWAALYARRHAFAELFGPWGLFEFGVQFFDAKLQAGHMDHIHVAFTGGVGIVKKLFGMGVGATPTPTRTGGDTGGGDTTADPLDTGAGDDATKAKKITPADPAERFRAARALIAISRTLGRIDIGDKVEANIRKRVAAINRDLRKVVTDQDMNAITGRVDKLRDRLQAALKKALDAARKTIDRRRDEIGEAWGRYLDKGFQVFDAKTAELVRKARAFVDLFGAEIGAGEETPKEKALRELREKRAADARAAERAEIDAIEDADERKRRLAEFELADQERTLEAAAAAERAAADQALETERQRITDERALLRERLEGRLQEIKDAFDREEITADEAQKRILAVLGEYGVSFEEAGRLLGSSFATSFNEAMSSSEKAVRSLIDAINDLRRIQGLPPVGASGGGGGGAPPDVFERAVAARSRSRGGGGGGRFVAMQHGGRVPGRFVGREDTVLMRATPGETVIDRRLTEKLDSFLDHAVHFRRDLPIQLQVLMELNGERLARAQARPMDDEIGRLISYRVEG